MMSAIAVVRIALTAAPPAEFENAQKAYSFFVLRAFAFGWTIVVAIGGIAKAQTADEFCHSFSSDKYANCMISRAYVAQAKTVVAKKIDAACFPDEPRGFGTQYLLNGDTEVINDAVSASVAEMGSQLFGKKPLKQPKCVW
jgi:hypothetical protein